MLTSFLALWLATGVHIQAATAAPAPAALVLATLAADDSPFFNLQFPGGTLREYVAALQKATPVNLVVDDGTSDLAMPPVSLKHIDVVTALSLIERTVQSPSGPATLVQVEQVNAAEAEATPTYRVQFNGPTPRTANDIVIESIADVISAGMKAEAVLSAIEAGTSVALGDRAKAMELNFHEPTSLLMARGPAEGCGAARQVVASLRSAVRPNRSALELQHQDQLATVRREAEKEVSMARRDMAEELMKLRVELVEQKAAVDAAKASAEHERSRAEAAEDALRSRTAEVNALRQGKGPTPANPK